MAVIPAVSDIPAGSVDRLLEIAAVCANAPDLDARSVDELLGYYANGLPG